MRNILSSFLSSEVEDNDQLFSNESFGRIWNMLMEEEEVAVMRCMFSLY